ncbi:MAG TPA: hypothetical protein VIM99_16535, partial [Blastocatellia bacterium]
MRKNRILGPSITILIAIIVCLVAVQVEQAAQQDQQPDKSASKAQNSQSSGQQSSDPQSSDGAATARWPVIVPRKSQSPDAQPPGDVAQEQKPEQKPEEKPEQKLEEKPEQKSEEKPEQKQDSKPAATPAPATQSPLQPLRPPSGNQGDQERIRDFTDLVSLPVTVTDAYNRLVTGLDKHHFEVFEDKVKQEISFFSDDDAPVNLGIVFDVSGSMKGKLDRARDALKAFIETSHSDDDFFLVGFNQR